MRDQSTELGGLGDREGGGGAFRADDGGDDLGWWVWEVWCLVRFLAKGGIL